MDVEVWSSGHRGGPLTVEGKTPVLVPFRLCPGPDPTPLPNKKQSPCVSGQTLTTRAKTRPSVHPVLRRHRPHPSLRVWGRTPDRRLQGRRVPDFCSTDRKSAVGVKEDGVGVRGLKRGVGWNLTSSSLPLPCLRTLPAQPPIKVSNIQKSVPVPADSTQDDSESQGWEVLHPRLRTSSDSTVL